MKKRAWILGLVSFLYLAGCISPNLSQRKVYLQVTTNPPGAKIVLVSLDTKYTATYFSPADIYYDPGICFEPSLIIESPGYARKVVRLTPDSLPQKLHITLDKITGAENKEDKPVQMGAPENMEENIKQWIPDIGAETPAFDPAHGRNEE